MTYAEAMSRTQADFWLMLWPLYLIIGAVIVGKYAAWIKPKK